MTILSHNAAPEKKMLNNTNRARRSPKDRAAFPTELAHNTHIPDGVSPAVYAINREILSVIMLRYMTYRLRAMYQAYDGDLTLSLVLGEIAVRNTENFFPERFYGNHTLSQMPQDRKRLPCNALSISDVTGIPRETVRRKLAKLLELGWIEKTPEDMYVISDKIGDVFAAFNDSQTFDLLSTSHRIEEVLHTPNRY